MLPGPRPANGRAILLDLDYACVGRCDPVTSVHTVVGAARARRGGGQDFALQGVYARSPGRIGVRGSERHSDAQRQEIGKAASIASAPAGKACRRRRTAEPRRDPAVHERGRRQGRQARDRARVRRARRRPHRAEAAARGDVARGRDRRQPQGAEEARRPAAGRRARDRRARCRRRADRGAGELERAGRDGRARGSLLHDKVRSVAPSELGDRRSHPRPDHARSTTDDDRGDDGSRRATPPSRSRSCRARRAGCSASIAQDKRGGGGHVLPVDRKQLRDWKVEAGDAGDAADGDLVRFDIARPRPACGAGRAHRRDARQPQGPAQDQPDRDPRAWPAGGVSRRRRARGARAAASRPRRAHGSAPACRC